MPNTEPYPTRWSTVHFGISAEEITDDSFTSVNNTLLARGWLVFINGDGWQDWGVQYNTGDNDNTMHIQVAVPTKADAAAAVALLRNSTLPFVSRTYTEIVSVVVTPSEDWTDEGYSELFA